MKALICLLGLLLAVPAAASPVVWTVAGTVTDIGIDWDTPLTLLAPVGQSFSVELVADPEAVDLCEAPTSGLYRTPGATVSVGGARWTASATFWEVNNQAGNCVPGGGIVTRSFFDGAPFTLLTLGWGDPSSEAFPTSIEAGFAWFAEPGAGPTVFAETEAGVEVSSVPEPASGLLLLTGLAAIRRRRKDL